MFIAALILLLTFALSSTAFAAAGGDFELARPILDAVMSGDYIWAAAAAVVLGTALVRKYGKRLWAPLGTGKGAAGVAVFAAFAGAVLTALTASGTLSWDVLQTALKVAIFSAGGVGLAKMFAPSWLRPVLDALLGSDGSRLQDAERAGLEAVAESPSKGSGIGFTDVP